LGSEGEEKLQGKELSLLWGVKAICGGAGIGISGSRPEAAGVQGRNTNEKRTTSTRTPREHKAVILEIIEAGGKGYLGCLGEGRQGTRNKKPRRTTIEARENTTGGRKKD